MVGSIDGGRTPTGPRILFVSHEASRTGAPIMLWNFLRWLRDNSDLEFEVLLLNDGPLVDDFASLAPVHLVRARGAGSITYMEAGMARAGFARWSDRVKVARVKRAIRHLQGFDALYLNSCTSALALRVLTEVPPVVFSHIHELDSALQYWFPPQDRDIMFERTDWFVACANAVSRSLVGTYGVRRSQVRCHYEFIEPLEPDATRTPVTRSSLGIPEGAFVAGGAGAVIWRKGPDLFVQAAAAVRRHRPDLDVHFVWVGSENPAESPPVRHDIARLDLADRVHFLGELRAPADVFSLFDAFCVTSREDPFPLVMLETAAMGVPVVSFANGGAVEFVEDGDGSGARGVIVPYLDVEGMASAIVDLAEAPAERAALGQRARERVLSEHTVEVAARRLYEDLVACVAATGTGTAPP
jgi:glycosyltransferase involved in cell wall biosynthesis